LHWPNVELIRAYGVGSFEWLAFFIGSFHHFNSRIECEAAKISSTDAANFVTTAVVSILRKKRLM
jgi:hypothetical protein